MFFAPLWALLACCTIGMVVAASCGSESRFAFNSLLVLHNKHADTHWPDFQLEVSSGRNTAHSGLLHTGA